MEVWLISKYTDASALFVLLFFFISAKYNSCPFQLILVLYGEVKILHNNEVQMYYRHNKSILHNEDGIPSSRFSFFFQISRLNFFLFSPISAVQG